MDKRKAGEGLIAIHSGAAVSLWGASFRHHRAGRKGGTTTAHYLMRQSAEQGGFALFLTTMAERSLHFLGRWVDVSKYDIRGSVTSHVQQAGVWVLASGALILGNFAGLIVDP